MKYVVVKGGKNWWFVQGKGHSWGSFPSPAEAENFIKWGEAGCVGQYKTLDQIKLDKKKREKE